jgi:hypothetical protein
MITPRCCGYAHGGTRTWATPGTDASTVTRFPGRDHFAAWNGTAPVEVSSGGRKVYRLSRRGNRRVNYAIHIAAVTRIRHKHSPECACYERKIAEGKTPRRRCALSSGGSATRSTPARWPTPERRRHQRTREGNRGTTLAPARPASTPNTGSSDKPLPGHNPDYGPPPPRPARTSDGVQQFPQDPVTQRGFVRCGQWVLGALRLRQADLGALCGRGAGAGRCAERSEMIATCR